MATFSSFKDFAATVDQMNKAIERDRKLWALEMAKRAQAIATAQASADLGGDPKFSGWKPPLDTHIKPTDTGAVLLPTRSGAGPWTVANQGRHNGNAGGFSGPGINRRTGVTARTKSGGIRKVRSVKGKRWNGVTKGFRTADKAVALMEHELPVIAEKGVLRTQRRYFDVT